jgi:hypothetical protein
MAAQVVTLNAPDCEACVDFEQVHEVTCTCGGRLLMGFDSTDGRPVVFHNKPECDLFKQYHERNDVVGFVRKLDEQLTETVINAQARVRGQE